MSRNFGDREGSNLRRPPLAVVLVAVVVIALGETGGAAMSRLKPQIERYVGGRVAANPQTHGLSGSAGDDDEGRHPPPPRRTGGPGGMSGAPRGGAGPPQQQPPNE